MVVAYELSSVINLLQWFLFMLCEIKRHPTIELMGQIHEFCFPYSLLWATKIVAWWTLSCAPSSQLVKLLSSWSNWRRSLLLRTVDLCNRDFQISNHCMSFSIFRNNDFLFTEVMPRSSLHNSSSCTGYIQKFSI